MATTPTSRTMLPVGTLLGGAYRIVRHLSSGGFGNTYEAVDAQGRHVAVKEFFMRDLMTRDPGTTLTRITDRDRAATVESQMRKFRKEALRLKQFDNPHIVRVYDYFEENATAYYVMDFIDGATLSEQLARRGHPFSEEQVRRLLPAILDALDSVHRAGFFHLDIKPSNIMTDRAGRVFLIDFGASKQLKADSSGATTGTQVSFTPDYAPAEIMESHLDKVGPWTDIYSLGATLYKLLTGHRPPQQTNIVEEGEGAFTFPSSVSTAMRRAIVRMMSIRRNCRPQSVGQLKALLEGCDAQDPASVPTPQTATAGSQSDVTVVGEAQAESATAPQAELAEAVDERAMDEKGVDERAMDESHADDGRDQTQAIKQAPRRAQPAAGEATAQSHAHQEQGAAQAPDYEDEAPRIRGWLTFFLVILGLNCALVICMGLANLVSTDYDGIPYRGLLKLSDFLRAAFFVALGVIAIHNFLTRKADAVFYARAFLVVNVLDNVVLLFIQSGSGSASSTDVGQLLRAMFWSAVWLLFLHNSSVVEEVCPSDERRVEAKDWAIAVGSFVVPWLLFFIWSAAV